MFGYVRTDTPYLFVKDETLYHAMYCGLCKGIAQVSGNAARMGLSYDVTFLSVLLHNISGTDVKIEKQHCLTHCIRVRKMAEVDELTRLLGAFNTALVYYKIKDDIEDEGKGRARRAWFSAGYKRAKKGYPEVVKIVARNMQAQAETERTGTDSLDRAADATALMLAEFSDYALGEKKTACTRTLFYSLGKWIYLIDALDDYDKDKKKGAYNPFVAAFPSENKAVMLSGEHGDEVRFAFHAIFSDIRESMAGIRFPFNRDLADNVLLRGLPATTERIMNGCSCQENARKRKDEK